MKTKIIRYIQTNRVSTTEVADAMNKQGSIEGVSPINRGHFAVGPVRWLYCFGGSNYELHRQIEKVQNNEILIIESFECHNKALFGDIVAKYCFLYRQVKAIVVLGKLRDAPLLLKENYAIWCQGFTPIGCHNQIIETSMDKAIIANRQDQYFNSVAVCDDSGVVVIPSSFINEKFYEALEFIENQEDIWYDCIDRLKMTTFETICLKKYHQ